MPTVKTTLDPVPLAPAPAAQRPKAAHAGPTTPNFAGRQEASAYAYRRLRELIVSGRLAPGAPLIETDLSGRLGMSRTPVRSALQRLQQEGFVAASNSGQMLRAFVAPLTADDMREVFLMVGALEASAARLAAEMINPARRRLADTLARLDAALADAAAARPPDLVRAQDLQVQFHRALIEAAAGPRLRSELDVLQPQAERYERVYTGAIIHAFQEAATERADIIAAIRDGDGDRAEQAVARNWRGSIDRYRRVVTILGERGNW